MICPETTKEDQNSTFDTPENIAVFYHYKLRKNRFINRLSDLLFF